MVIYPSFRLTDEQLIKYAEIWSAEFKDDSCELVSEGFRIARMESPAWMPSVPSIQAAIRSIISQAKPKSKDEEFKDAHCGKTQEEWVSLKSWEKSKDGAEKIKAYKQRLAELVGI